LILAAQTDGEEHKAVSLAVSALPKATDHTITPIPKVAPTAEDKLFWL